MVYLILKTVSFLFALIGVLLGVYLFFIYGINEALKPLFIGFSLSGLFDPD